MSLQDWQYGIAYNAALKLCTILLYTEGYRPENNNAHYRTIDAMPYILGPKRKTDGDYLNACRGTRNTLEYERTNEVNQDDVNELIEFVKELKQERAERDCREIWQNQSHLSNSR